VGMTEAELDTLLAPTGDAKNTHLAAIFGRALLTGEPEFWRFYPTLNLGVLLRDGKVAGISVTPVKG